MSKINLSLDFDEIRKRIELDKIKYKPSEWAKNIGVSKNIVTNIHGETKQRPSMEYIIAVARATGKPIEWYLYGEKAISLANNNQKEYCKFCGDMTEETKELCEKVKDIMDCKNTIFAVSLKTVIAAFEQCRYRGKEKRAPMQKLNQIKRKVSSSE